VRLFDEYCGKGKNFGKILRAKFSAFLAKTMTKNTCRRITNSQQNTEISENRDTGASEICDMACPGAEV
jgi:hypothetical protein